MTLSPDDVRLCPRCGQLQRTTPITVPAPLQHAAGADVRYFWGDCPHADGLAELRREAATARSLREALLLITGAIIGAAVAILVGWLDQPADDASDEGDAADAGKPGERERY